MEHRLQSDAMKIIRGAIRAVQPDGAVVKALAGKEFPGRVILVSVGKAAWQMARAAHGCLGGRIDGGIVITKYGHAKGKSEISASSKRGIRWRMRIPSGLHGRQWSWSAALEGRTRCCFCCPAAAAPCLRCL